MDVSNEPELRLLAGGRLSEHDARVLALAVLRLVCLHEQSLLGAIHACAQVAYDEGMSASTDSARVALMQDILATISRDQVELIGTLIRSERQAGKRPRRLDLSRRLESALQEASADLEGT
jgi:hypothetical protein